MSERRYEPLTAAECIKALERIELTLIHTSSLDEYSDEEDRECLAGHLSDCRRIMATLEDRSATVAAKDAEIADLKARLEKAEEGARYWHDARSKSGYGEEDD